MKKDSKKKILVGISGGVDSFMTAHFLQQTGWEVTGAYLKMQENEKQLISAEKSADRLGIKLKIVDVHKEFEKRIVENFIKSYQRGQTPNPCVVCNPLIKFSSLLALAKKEKIEKIATGHYAKISQRKVAGQKKFFLKKGLDKKKDQSYFLYRLPAEWLEKIIFPLGEKNKEAIKKEAKRIGFYENNFQPESQDICFFLSEKGLAGFLQKQISFSSGKIVNEKGLVLGQHRGLEKYTLGQRKGIELSGGPFFVIEKNFQQNKLVVTKDKKNSSLWKKQFFLKQLNWLTEKPKARKKYSIKVRYSQNEASGRIVDDQKVGWQVILDKAQWAPAAGQSAVIYSGDIVVGGGIIGKEKISICQKRKNALKSKHNLKSA